MIRNFKFYFLISFIITFSACTVLKPKWSNNSQASVITEGYFSMFQKGLSYDSALLWSEASAILFDGKKVFFANDKDLLNAKSAVCYWPVKNDFPDTINPPLYLQNPLLKKAQKFEDFTKTPDGKFVLLTTGFDRIKNKNDHSWDGYNSLLYWPTNAPDKAKVFSFSGKDSTSVSLREKFGTILKDEKFPNGVPYFKIEGLAATREFLLFGVREQGVSYKSFDYKIKILKVSYNFSNNTLTLKNDWEVLADIDIKKIAPTIQENIGLSSIEYDKDFNTFFILTSFEDANENKVGAYLWTASFNDLQNNKMYPVYSKSGSYLKFTNKAEDLTKISKNKYMVIFDDDRVVTEINGIKRQHNQSGYSIIELRSR